MTKYIPDELMKIIFSYQKKWCIRNNKLIPITKLCQIKPPMRPLSNAEVYWIQLKISPEKYIFLVNTDAPPEWLPAEQRFQRDMNNNSTNFLLLYLKNSDRYRILWTNRDCCKKNLSRRLERFRYIVDVYRDLFL
jgi:hypothetical protein